MEHSIFNDDHPVAQLGLIVLTCLGSLFLLLFVGALFALPLFHINPADLRMEISNFGNIPLQKYLQFIQGIGLFIIPAILLGKVFSNNSFNYLHINKIPPSYNFFLVLIILVASLPIIDLLASFNSWLHLPKSLSDVQDYIDKTSKNYQTITESFMKVTTIKGLAVNLVVMAIIPALGEELLFRGIFQRIFSNWARNVHWGIMITAFIFSVVHFEFYGFLPRLAFGVMFGYFLLWSGSIWLPILAHFINNSISVVLYYLIANGMVNKKIADVGAISDRLPLIIISGLFLGTGLYLLYKKRIKS
jgi:uncharacterized protein